MRAWLLLSGGFALVAGCTPAVDNQMVDQMENAVRGGLAAQGTVKQVELTRENDNRMTGFAVVEPREAPGTEARFNCTAERQGTSGAQFSWQCNPPSGAPGETQSAAAPGGKDPQPVAAAQPTGLDRAPYVGRWTDTGDCNVVTVLQADGVFITATGARGNWDVQGDQFTFSGPGGTSTWTVMLEDPNTLRLTNAEGTSGQSTRC